jgi:ABC-type branched-subunit amino acid transport system ATPase component
MTLRWSPYQLPCEGGRSGHGARHNGAGKTTTLKSIMGIVGKRTESVQFANQEIIRTTSDRIARGALRMAHPTRLERVASTFGEQRSLYARQPRNNLFIVASSGASRPAVFPERCISTRSAICRRKHPAEQESRSITSQQWRTVIARAVGRRVGLLCTRIIVPLQMATISECRYRWCVSPQQS